MADNKYEQLARERCTLREIGERRHHIGICLSPDSRRLMNEIMDEADAEILEAHRSKNLGLPFDVELCCTACQREKLATAGRFDPTCYCGGTFTVVVEHDHVLTHAEAVALGYGIRQAPAADGGQEKTDVPSAPPR